LSAQSLEQARRLYLAGKYDEAKPAFEKLVKQAPNNASYNHWYGVCCYETGEWETAESYLKIAAGRRVQESGRYLGELYIKTYRFEEAVGRYTEYIDMVSKKNEDIEPYKRRLELAEKAQRMLEKVENIQIIDSVVVNKNNFLEAYPLSEESGSLTLFANFFRTDNPVYSTVYRNEIGDKIFYAYPYGEEEKRYSLFTQSRLSDKWGDEKRLPENINSSLGNNNFPFVLTDGVTIYYASEGNGSIGGYDLFVTRYNIHSDSYLTPEQLGMPFNSMANDYMLVIDETKGLGWFASDRNQPDDRVCLYLFIPDERRSRMEGQDMETKRQRALITSIADSWAPSTDYSALIRLAHTKMPSTKKETRKDFELIINNNLVYYTWDDFKSLEARNLYEKRMQLCTQISDLHQQLEELRRAYAEGNKARKEALTPAIRQAEEAYGKLLPEAGSLEKKARNAEVNHLKVSH
jgi:tetratricopeptide (TPR) repeat protein